MRSQYSLHLSDATWPQEMTVVLGVPGVHPQAHSLPQLALSIPDAVCTKKQLQTGFLFSPPKMLFNSSRVRGSPNAGAIGNFNLSIKIMVLRVDSFTYSPNS